MKLTLYSDCKGSYVICHICCDKSCILGYLIHEVIDEVRDSQWG